MLNAVSATKAIQRRLRLEDLFHKLICAKSNLQSFVTFLSNQDVFVKCYDHKKVIFNIKVKASDLSVILKGIISGVYMPNIKSLSHAVQKS